MADTGQQGQLVGLEAHPGPPAIAEAPPGELGPNVISLYSQPGRQSLDYDYKALAVGLAGGQKAQHAKPW